MSTSAFPMAIDGWAVSKWRTAQVVLESVWGGGA